MKIRLVGAELFLSVRQTDVQTYRRDETNSRFSQFLRKAPKKNLLSLPLSNPGWSTQQPNRYTDYVTRPFFHDKEIATISTENLKIDGIKDLRPKQPVAV